jgi:hypothetical protein
LLLECSFHIDRRVCRTKIGKRQVPTSQCSQYVLHEQDKVTRNNRMDTIMVAGCDFLESFLDAHCIHTNQRESIQSSLEIYEGYGNLVRNDVKINIL